MISVDEVKKIARLSCLELSEEETEQYAKEFNTILEHFEVHLKMFKDGVEFLGVLLGFFLAQFKAGKPCDFFDFVNGNHLFHQPYFSLCHELVINTRFSVKNPEILASVGKGCFQDQLISRHHRCAELGIVDPRKKEQAFLFSF